MDNEEDNLQIKCYEKKSKVKVQKLRMVGAQKTDCLISRGEMDVGLLQEDLFLLKTHMLRKNPAEWVACKIRELSLVL